MNKWKKEALEKLQEIESQNSVYTHQKIILDNERPSIFYTIPEKRLSIDDAISLVRANLPLQLPSGEFSQAVTKQVLKLLEKSKEKINSVASLFVAIESNWGVVDEKFTRTKFYDHYHPPRGNNDEISTLSYFSPIHIENDVTEKFYYCDLSKINLEGKPYRYWRENNPLDIAKDFQQLSSQTKPHNWKNLEFPKEGALEVAFDSFFNLHNLTGLSGNMFLTIVINDVEMKTKLQKGELNFTYLNSSEI